VIKDLEDFPLEDKKRIVHSINEMEKDPFVGDVKPIRGAKGLFRKRIGDYRVFFTIDFQKDEVAILRVGQRENFYQ
jgi:mRNA interferase RelE/StbE